MKTLIKKEPNVTLDEINVQIATLLKKYPTFSDMREKCQCCANCENWNVEHSLSREYEFNTCFELGTSGLTKCCIVCDKYKGKRVEKNIDYYTHLIVEINE